MTSPELLEPPVHGLGVLACTRGSHLLALKLQAEPYARLYSLPSLFNSAVTPAF